MTFGFVLVAVLGLPPPALADGLGVGRVAPGTAAAAADLRAGDELLGWAQGDQRGDFASPLDVVLAELERGPRGAVILRAERAGKPLVVTLFPDDWGIELAPAAGTEHAGAYAAYGLFASAGSRRLTASAPEVVAASQALEEASAAAREAGEPARAALLSHLEGRVWLAGGRLDEARDALTRAIAGYRALDTTAASPLAAAAALADLAQVTDERGSDLEEGARATAEALATYEQLAPRSLARARALLLQARFAERSEEKRRLREQALALSEALAPEGLATADALDAVASLARDVALVARAVAIRERLAPESVGTALSLSSQASILRTHGEMDAAEATSRRAVAMLERLRPEGEDLAQAMTNLGAILAARGDLAGTEELDRRALAISEVRTPGSWNVARHLNNLALTNRLQLDFEAAEAHLQRAVAILAAVEPEGDLMPRVYTNLGEVARERGDFAAALGFYRRVEELLAKQDAHPLRFAYLRQRQGLVLAAQGREEEAAALYTQALAAAEAHFRRSLSAAEARHLLGELSLRRGLLAKAEEQLTQALAMRAELAPGSLAEAESSHALGLLARRRNQREEAVAYFRRAVDALEAQAQRLGGAPETRIRFRARYRAIYRDLEDLLLELGRPDEAFLVSERSRARGLLSLLASRPLRLAGSLPAELAAARARANADYDRALAALGAESAADAAHRAALTAALTAARRRREEVRARMRVAAPRAADLLDPVPLDLAGVQATLDPGTLLLAYSIGPHAARVFVIAPAPAELMVVSLATDQAALAAEVRRFRELIAATRGRLGRQRVLAQARRLTELLLVPVAAPIGRAERLLVVPDGALHLLPFAALLDPAPKASPQRHLVEALAVHSISSATLYAVTRAPAAPAVEPLPVVAFGDPAYPPAAAAPAPMLPLRGALGRDVELRPLPATRAEVETVRELAPVAAVWLGAEATEERAKALPPRARVVHFACHGFLDADFPLESGLALATPAPGVAGDNGFLQAWEVLEQMRTDAELVTLSACATGLGQEMAGEGLLGLTWAFQYAGARAVLASLWEVSDRSTAELMRHLYGALAAGASRAEALRRAQLALLREPATAPPFYWAAFQLVGDGR